MHHHCFEVIKDGIFVLDTNLDIFTYGFKAKQWQKIQSDFPCDNINQNRTLCKALSNDFVIAPSVKDGKPCTGVFDINTKTWSALEFDQRNAIYNGTIQSLPDSDTVVYFGGYTNASNTRDEKMWIFDRYDFQWEEYSIKLPNKLLNDTLVMTVLNPDTCK